MHFLLILMRIKKANSSALFPRCNAVIKDRRSAFRSALSLADRLGLPAESLLSLLVNRPVNRH